MYISKTLSSKIDKINSYTNIKHTSTNIKRIFEQFASSILSLLKYSTAYNEGKHMLVTLPIVGEHVLMCTVRGCELGVVLCRMTHRKPPYTSHRRATEIDNES